MANKPNGKPNGVGRPRLDIDPNIVKEMAGIGCTIREIATVMGCSRDTIERHFAEEIVKGQEESKAKLRRRQWQSAMGGSPAMLIWLGKQMLGQADKQELSGSGGRPIQHEFIDLTRLSDGELSEVERLIESATSKPEVAGER